MSEQAEGGQHGAGTWAVKSHRCHPVSAVQGEVRGDGATAGGGSSTGQGP